MADSGKPPDLGPCESKATVEQKTVVKDDSADSISSDDRSTTSLKEKELHQADDGIHQDRDGLNMQRKADAGKEHEHRDKSFVSSAKDETSGDLDSKGAVASSKKSPSLNEGGKTGTDGRSSVDLQSDVVAGKECVDPASEGDTVLVQEESSVDLPRVEKHVDSDVGSDNLHQHTTEESPNGMKMQGAAGMEVSKETTSKSTECKGNENKSYSGSAAGNSKDAESKENKANEKDDSKSPTPHSSQKDQPGLGPSFQEVKVTPERQPAIMKNEEKGYSNAGPVQAITGPVRETPAITGPVQETAAITGPVRETPAITGPVRETPAITGPVQETPAITGPVRETPAITGPVQETPAITGPVRETPAITGPVQETPAITGPVRETAAITGPVQETPAITGPVQETPAITGPVRETAVITKPKSFASVVKESAVDKSSKELLPPLPPPIPPPDTSGLYVPSHQGITVVFHILLPFDLWKCDRNTSQLHICFGHKQMGDWRPVGNFQPVCEVRNGLMEFYCDFSIDGRILNQSCIPYKYFLSGKEKPYEFLHETKSYGNEVVNRCLVISAEKVKLGGILHQFDGTMFPENIDKDGRWWDWVPGAKYLRTGGKIIPPHNDVQTECLQHYLRYSKDILLELKVVDVHGSMIHIKDVFDQLECPKVYHHFRSHPWPAVKLPQALKDWLLSVLRELQSVPSDTTVGNGRKIASVLCIMLCFDFLIPRKINMSDIPKDTISMMMSMMSLHPDVKQRKCDDLHVVNGCIPDAVKKLVISVILSFCNHLSYTTSLSHPFWLYAVPLIHLLQGACQPFDGLQLDTEKIVWSDPQLGLYSVRRKAYSSKVRLIEEHYPSLEPLLQVDPLLLPILMYICPRQQLVHLIKEVPLFISTCWICHLIKDNYDYHEKDISMLITEVSKLRMTIHDIQESLLLNATTKICCQLLLVLLANLRSTSKNYQDTLMGSLSLVLYAIEILKTKRNGSHNSGPELKKVCEQINKWILKQFTSPFEIQSQHFHGKQNLQEMMVWDDLLKVDCPQGAKPIWLYVVKAALTQRVQHVNPIYKMKLFFVLGSYSQRHPELENVIITETMERMIQLTDTELSSSLETIHNQMNDRRIGATVLSDILKNKYPGGVKMIDRQELLSWPLWPTYLKIYSSLTYVPSDEMNAVCSKALVVLRGMHCEIVTGNLTIQQVHDVKRHKKLLKKLCDAAGTIKYFELEASLSKHESDYDDLMRRVQNLKMLFSKILSYLNIKGVKDLYEKMNMNYKDIPLSILLSRSEGHVSLTQQLEICSPLNFMLEKYIIISENSLFDRVWNETISEIDSEDRLSVEDIVSRIWDPTIHKCAEILTTLANRTITLAVVDHYFQLYFLNKEAAQEDIVNLFHKLRRCIPSIGISEVDEEQIKGSINVVDQYWSLCTYAHAARVCLDLKEALRLRGNFEDVKVLASQDVASMKGQSLDQIDSTLINTGKFLLEFASEEKLSCLETYCRCHNIVSWLRSNTKDVTDLQSFVTVALNNAAGGEDTLTNAKLSSLRAVGSGFGYLIYELKADADFHALAKGCRFVWEAMQHTRHLPQYLVRDGSFLEFYLKENQISKYGIKIEAVEDCNNELEWFKRVKAQEGSVKETTFEQMNMCFQHGEYKVGESGSSIFTKVNDIVVLTVEAEHARKYTLDELKDLESKLVLITGSRDDRRKQVDGFLDTFHTICEIAELLIALQQDGNVQYIGWYITVPCKLEIMPELRKLHNAMNCELQSWREEVREARSHHYELNYFTTPQLLTLRKELGYLKSRSVSISRLAQALLHSIAPVIDRQVLLDSLTIVLDEPTSLATHEQTVSVSEKEQESEEVDESPCDLDHLSPAKKDILKYIVGIYGSRVEKVVLQAFEDGETEQDDIENWIREQDEKADGSEADSSGDELDNEVPLHQHRAKESFKMEQISHSKRKERRVLEVDKPLMTEKEAVDESHPAVQELIEAGYGREMSISAIEKYGSAENATEHLVALQADCHESIPKNIGHVEAVNDKPAMTQGICCFKKTVKDYLTIPELGNTLRHFHMHSVPAKCSLQSRTFHLKSLKTGSPNLLVVPKDRVLWTAVSLYMAPEDIQNGLPLPTFEEMLICQPWTTSEEVEILWQRAVQDPEHRRIFCLIHAEILPYQICDSALRYLHETIEGKKDYRLVIICSNENEDQSLMIAKLAQYRRPYWPPEDVTIYQKYFLTHFENPSMEEIDGIRSSVRVVCSTRPGMGKSLCIKNMTKVLTESYQLSCVRITVPIHGPNFSVASLIKSLAEHVDNQHCVVHLDIAPNVMWQLDTTLFSMLIQRGLSDQHGNVWRADKRHYYAIEVTLTGREVEKNGNLLALIKLLPTVECISPRKCLSLLGREIVPGRVLFDVACFKDPFFQRVYQYLRRYKAGQSLDTFFFRNSVEGNTSDCLQLFLRYCGLQDPSWAEINHFVQFLNIQLSLCENSVFCNPDLVGDIFKGFKTFVVNFMIQMSRDFATSSLHGEASEELQEDTLMQYQIVDRRLWEKSAHPYIFFNNDEYSNTLTFVGFMVSKAGDLIDAKHHIIEKAIMSPQLKETLQPQGVDFGDDYTTWKKPKMISKISTVMGLGCVPDPDPSYVLTVDNLIKILAIQMRFRCGIPVVLMGETGCGKTRLIRYMCDLASQSSGMKNMLILKVHGGTTENDIVDFVRSAQKQGEINKAKGLTQTVVFFDEANTTDAIGLIKEIMCDRTLYGKPIVDNVKFIAACNPYKRHSDDMIKKLETAGLGFYVHAEKTKERLGKIPLRNLVYRVQELPPSMKPLVYDFGQLKEDQEERYISHIVNNNVCNSQLLCTEGTASVITDVLSWSQKYMRGRKDECSFVSLRDVERAMLVFEYFYKKMSLLSPLMDKTSKETYKDNEVKFLVRSLILALSVCYHGRLQNRNKYEEGVVKKFSPPLELAGKVKQFRREIQSCQEVLLESMQLGRNIARNSALRENVFMMAICIDLRIPLFLVGKPGSSKSLAKSIVANSMNGKSSKNELLKSFKEVHMFSYQCSQLSTSESIIKVFETAKSFQREDTSNFVSVVVLDEVGLAEDSPNLPLKALHPLLEDGTAGADASEEREGNQYMDQIIEREKRVAFIGISNWALDPAKMNRGVMVTRGDPDIEELELSARGICSTKEKDDVRDHLERYFKPLAKAYDSICKKQERQFFGLRDFYSLIKMLYWMCKRTAVKPTSAQLSHAIMRNFGGMEDFSVFDEFKAQLPLLRNLTLAENLIAEINPDCSPRGLIKASLQTRDTTWHGENRYLLFLTENYAALEVLKHYIYDPHPTEKLQSLEIREPQQSASSHPSTHEIEPWEMEPFVLFGSSFPRDTEYTQVCRNINQIKICMETGRMVVLLNLHNLYESLYDLLNQYYIRYGEERYVDLGLQTHKLKCKVHKEFKLIMIAEKATVYEKFPTPLINRLEKHFVLMSSILSTKEKTIMEHLQLWIQNFSKVDTSTFQERDAFIGYREDTPAAVVFQANHLLQNLLHSQDMPSSEWIFGAFDKKNCSVLTSSVMETSPEEWNEIVLELCKYLLLYTCSPAALVRLTKTPLSADFNRFCDLYKRQHHNSIGDFLKYHIDCCWNRKLKTGLLMQVTTHSHLLSSDEVEKVEEVLKYETGSISSFLLHDFDTELHFSSKVGPLFKSTKDRLIIIQCDMGYITDDLIACARHRIYDLRANAEREIKDEEVNGTHVLFIIHLPVQTMQSSLVGFQGEPWISAHIDEVRPTSEGNITLDIAQGVSISKMFYGPFDDETLVQDREFTVSVSPEYEVPPGQSFRSGPQSQVMTIAGPTNEVLPSVPGTTKSPVAGPTAQVLSSSGPAKQVISVASPTVQMLPAETLTPQHIHRKFVPTVFTQCRRLHICIQAAASNLIQFTPNKRWATKRIDMLTRLIPDEPEFPLDTTSFYGIMVKHIHTLLQRRDEAYGSGSNWILEEAMNMRKLHIGGTFRNALTRRIDNVIIPLFAKVIAVIDQNRNLRHLNGLGKKQCSIHDLWLKIFSNPSVLGLNYEEMTGQQKTPVADDFYCDFPFSWLIKETIETQWECVKNTSDSAEEQYEQLHSVFSQTLVGRILNDFEIQNEGTAEDQNKIQNEGTAEDLLQRYVGDLLHMVYTCVHICPDDKHIECSLLQSALKHLSKKFVPGDMTLTKRIVAVHVVYHSNEEKIHWFGQLTLCMPGILQHLKTVTLESSEMELHLLALQKVLDNLKPKPREKEAVVKQWLNHVTKCQNAVDSILTISGDHPLARQTSSDWQRIQLLQKFIQHVVMKYDGMGIYANRLQLHMKKDVDFSKLETVERLKVFQKALHRELKEKYKTKDSMELFHDIMKSCDNFFLEVVSTLCFGQATIPESDLIEMLFDLIFSESTDDSTTTRQLTLRKQKDDETPVIRSFLLQLLLGQDSECLHKYLQRFFDKSLHALGPDHNQDLLLMCSQCFEDGLVKKHSSKPWNQQLSVCVDLLQSSREENKVSLKYLEMIAGLRYALSIVAELLHKNSIDTSTVESQETEAVKIQDDNIEDDAALLVNSTMRQQEPSPDVVKRNTAVQLLESAKSLCASSTSGPLHYLIRQIVRHFGFSSLRGIVEVHPWVIPESFNWTGEVINTLDIFVIYGKQYIDLRENIHAAAAYGQKFHQLSLTTKGKEIQDCGGLLLFSLFQLVIKNKRNQHSLSSETSQALCTIIQGSKVLSEEVKTVAKKTLNENEGPLALMTKTWPSLAQNYSVIATIFHSVAVLVCRQKSHILLPFTAMLCHPSSLVKCYLPTMPDGLSKENIIAIVESGQLYECTNGHPVFVNECQKRISVTCSDCNAPMKIGSEKAVLKDDTEYQGHCLSSPESRSCVPSGMRCLSSAGCAIIRAIMHSSLLWATFNSKILDMHVIVKTEELQSNELSEYFFLHLMKDIEILAKAIHRNEDEAAIVIHLVLKQILLTDSLTSGFLKSISTLTNPRQRDEWEKCFNKTYIQPVLTNLDKYIQMTMKGIMEDSEKEHNPLFYMVYDESDTFDDDGDAYLWSYRSRITFDHLAIQLQPHKEKYCILTKFIEQEPILRATPYLADIVKLQHALYKHYHHRITVEVAEKKTIGEFLEERHLPQRLLHSFAKAWSLVKNKLADHARIKVKHGFLVELPEIAENTALQYLIPTTTGPGICSFALVDYLVVQHNSFMEMCQGVMSEEDKSESFKIWKAHRIRLSFIHCCHLLDYEQQIMSIILSHCHYSLHVGKGQDIIYDFDALEKHIIDRFIQGKPKIIPDMINVSYTKDTYTATNFFAIRSKVQEQVELPMKLQHEILSELLEVDQTAEALDIIYIVLRFLSSGGGRATMKLGDYLLQLKMDSRLLWKIAEHCTLGHIISLWKALSVDFGKKMIKNGQEPFEVDVNLKQDLEEGSRNALSAYLSEFSDHDNLLGVLCEFIEYVEGYLKYNIPIQQEWTLQETLMAFLERNQQEVPHVCQLPGSIKLSQTVATWKFIVAFQEARQV